jgi:adenylyltransferase/sulfurtransferase
MKIERVQSAPDPFARQSLIPGWDQEPVSNARVLITGVGALGNACAADLALTGVRNFVLVDFDEIETSNLSRTLFFRRGDEGRPKVEAAAAQLREVILCEESNVLPLRADVVSDLGAGVYRRVDLVFGCVDSAEARAAVGARGIEFGIPTIFGGIYGYDGSVMVQGDRGGSCIACSFGASERANMGQRYSCDQVRRALVQEAKFPTTHADWQVGGIVDVAIEVLRSDGTPARDAVVEYSLYGGDERGGSVLDEQGRMTFGAYRGLRYEVMVVVGPAIGWDRPAASLEFVAGKQKEPVTITLPS